MSYQKYIYTFVYLYLCTVFGTVLADEACDKTKCPGPLAYYDALNCTPIYKTEGDCCAIKYNCDHLNNRSKDKCYVQGGVYDLGETLKEEHANPCDIECTCTRGHDGVAAFNCAVADCFFGEARPGCYIKRSPASCCPGEEVCPKDPEDRARCNVDGKEYRDGEYFFIPSDPDLSCVCQPEYEGKNIEPFCHRPAHPYCSPDFRDASDIHNKCAPVYSSTQNPSTSSCSVFSRCQNSRDTVIKAASASDSGNYSYNFAKTVCETNVGRKPYAMTVSFPDSTCTFGDLTMNIGDELNQATDFNSVCVKCVCQVPPAPTCQRLSDKECDMTAHASSD